MKKLFASAAIIVAALSLSGCDVFYPNSTESPTPSSSSSASETPSTEPSDSSSPTPTATTIVRERATVRVIQSALDSGAGKI